MVEQRFDRSRRGAGAVGIDPALDRVLDFEPQLWWQQPEVEVVFAVAGAVGDELVGRRPTALPPPHVVRPAPAAVQLGPQRAARQRAHGRRGGQRWSPLLHAWVSGLVPRAGMLVAQPA